MLQWNSKYTVLAVVAILVVLAVVLGNFNWAGPHLP